MEDIDIRALIQNYKKIEQFGDLMKGDISKIEL